jgi:hypothetical protein
MKTFTVFNAGLQNLTGLAIAKNGTHAADFTVGAIGASTLAPGASTTFTLPFAPSGLGTRTAAIHLASNDADENPFAINLTGNGLDPSLDVAAGLDFSGTAVSSSGQTPWLWQATTTHDGSDAAQSGVITDSQSSAFSLAATGPGTVSFWWKVSSEAGWDFLRFSIDGVEQSGKISGTVDWQQRSYELGAGSHTLQWSYTKDIVDSAGSDCGWVDQVVLPMGAQSPVTTWLLANGYPAGTDLQVDPNSDGVNFLMAYALNLDPKLNLSSNMPRPVLAGNQLGLTFYAGNPDVTYRVETSTDLQAWTTNGVTVSAMDANKFRTATVPMAGAQRFMRLGVSVAGASPVVSWLVANGFAADANLESDPNGDGVNLLLAYALNLDPKLKLSASMPRPVVTGNQLSLAFYAGSAGVTYAVETSTDLINWSTTGVSLSAQDAGKFRIAAVPLVGPRRFLRLVVSIP